MGHSNRVFPLQQVGDRVHRAPPLLRPSPREPSEHLLFLLLRQLIGSTALELSPDKPLYARKLSREPRSERPASGEVELDGTLRIRSTSYRAQNRAHVEGGFGLLKPTLEGLTLESGSPETLAASYLHNLVTAAARAVNQRPRRDRGGKSRLDLLLAVATTSRLERLFWLTAIADVVNTQANDDRHRLFRLCARRIAATYALSPRDRTASIRFLAAKIIELN